MFTMNSQFFFLLVCNSLHIFTKASKKAMVSVAAIKNARTYLQIARRKQAHW